jgi:hypothetical protein
VSECVLTELDALGNGSAYSIYLGDKIISRFGRTTGRRGRRDRHVVFLEFGNSRRVRSRSGQIRSGPGIRAAESAEDTVRVVLMMKREFAELDALSVMRSTWKIISSADLAGGRVTLVGVVATSKFSDSGIRGVADAWGVRSDLSQAKTLPPAVGKPEAGFLGTVTSGKLPKAKENSTVTSI